MRGKVDAGAEFVNRGLAEHFLCRGARASEVRYTEITMSSVRVVSLWLLCLCSVLILPGIANRDFSTRGEPREALVAQSMLTKGEVVLGSGYGGDVPSKPPLLHWLGVLSSLPMGEVTATSARLPSAVAAIFALIFLLRFVSLRYGLTRGVLTALILLTSIEWFRSSITARVDMLLAASLLGGLLCMFEWTERKCEGLPWTCLVFFGLATLTKGPVSIVLPAGILIAWLCLQGVSLRATTRATAILFVPTVCIAGLWYLAAFLERPEAFLDKIWYENVARFLGSQEDEPHRGSALALYATMFVGLLPWSLCFFSGLATWKKFICSPLREGRSYWHAADSFTKFSWIVLSAFLVFFAIPGSKRSVYLLPAYPFVAFLLSSVIAAWEAPRQWSSRLLGALGVLVATVFCAAGWLRDVIPSMIESERARNHAIFYLDIGHRFFADIHPIVLSCCLFATLISLVVLGRGSLPWIERKGDSALCWPSLASLWIVMLFIGNSIIFPVVANSLSSRSFAQVLVSQIPASEKLYSFGTAFYGLSFYMNRRIEYLGKVALPRGEERLVLVSLDDQKLLQAAGYEGKELMRSSSPLTKPGDYVVLMKVRRNDKLTHPAMEGEFKIQQDSEEWDLLH